jgi:MFS family permease
LARWISSIGDGLVFVAFPLLATRLTHSPVLIAGVAFAASVPWLVLALPAGALADRVSRKRLLTTVEIARMVVLVLLGLAILTGHLVIAELYVATFLIAAFETVFDSASMAVIPQLVDHEDLLRANSRLHVAQLSGEQFIGPALGGLALAAAASLPVLLDGVSFAASAALIALALRPVRRLGRHGPARRADGFALVEPRAHPDRPSFVSQIREGLSWLVHEPRMRLLAALISCFAFTQAMGLAVVVIYCTRVLHLTVAAFGLFTAAAASGNTIGAWAAPRVHKALGTGPMLVAAGCVGGASLFCLGLTGSTAIAILALGGEAVAVGAGKVAAAALRQELVPLGLAGRVSSAFRSSIVGAASVGALVGGALVAIAGPHAPFTIGGAIQVVAALVIGGALARRLAVHDRQVIDLRETIDLTDSPAAAEA